MVDFSEKKSLLLFIYIVFLIYITNNSEICVFRCGLVMNWQLQGVTLPSPRDIWTVQPRMRVKSGIGKDQ